MKIKTKIFAGISVFWMILIFYMSSQDVGKSTEFSNRVTQYIIDILEPENKGKQAISQTDTINANKKSAGKEKNKNQERPLPQNEWFGVEPTNFSEFVRTCAHFTLFLFLGIFISYTLILHYGKYNFKIAFTVLYLCFLYAVIDEIHQMFVQGRGAELKDVLMDCAGSLTGIIIVFAVNFTFWVFVKRSKNNLKHKH